MSTVRYEQSTLPILQSFCLILMDLIKQLWQMDDNPIADKRNTTVINDTTREQMKVKLNVSDHYCMACIITSLFNIHMI